jgi:hypothetical protein
MRRQYALLALLLAGGLNAQTASTGNSDDTANYDRILGIIPNYQTVSEPTPTTPPLTVRQKWKLFLRESVDPFTFASAGFGAAISQAHNGDPKYGRGMAAYGQRFGAALADETSQDFFSDAVLATWLHQDPRYFRRGPGRSIVARSFYAMSRTFVCRTDSGRSAVNWSNLIGTGLGIGLSNVYYPPQSVTLSENGSRFLTSLTGSALGNLLPEFWPDLRKKFLHKTDRGTTP